MSSTSHSSKKKGFGKAWSLSGLLLRTSLIFLFQLSFGCDRKSEIVEELSPPPPFIPPPAPINLQSNFLTHLPVQVDIPDPLKTNLLWVSLKPFLGSRNPSTRIRKPTLLKSVEGELFLEDSLGQIYQSKEILIHWKEKGLQQPIHISRKVLGPFASYESAEKASLPFKKMGLNVLIAHPDEWEVWLPSAQEIPKAFKLKNLKKSLNTLVKPYIEGPTGFTELFGPIRISAQDGLLWKGAIYKGPFQLQNDAYGSWTLIEEIDLEKYLEGVVPHEIGLGVNQVALAAQTVLARTWALANTQRFLVDGYHLCTDTQCQVYKDPTKANSNVIEAINATRGKLLFWEGKPVKAFYHASNGGVKASASEAWKTDDLPYFRPALDGPIDWIDQFEFPFPTNTSLKTFLNNGIEAYGAKHPRFRWERNVSSNYLKNALSLYGSISFEPYKISIIERGESGRVLALKISSKDLNSSVLLRLDEIRRTLPVLPSTLFVVEKINESLWSFTGGGFGHGVGLSQAGAIDLAARGWSLRQILNHYYPETNYGPLPQLGNSL